MVRIASEDVGLIEHTQGSTVTTGFPIYDAHGNNVATLSRSGAGGYSVADRRSYDAWGVVRSQQSAGDPTLRYCANLGHKQDDESGLIYMRARYYEPTSGRFVSEDLGRDGSNWFVYCGNEPLERVDYTGRWDDSSKYWAVGLFAACGLALELDTRGYRPAALAAMMMACGLAAKLLGTDKVSAGWKDMFWAVGTVNTIAGILEGGKMLEKDARTQVLAMCVTTYCVAVMAAVIDTYVID